MEKRDIIDMTPGEVRDIAGVSIRYDGAYDWIPGDDGKSWTLLSHYVDATGADRFKGSFGLAGLEEIGVIKSIAKASVTTHKLNGGNNQ